MHVTLYLPDRDSTGYRKNLHAMKHSIDLYLFEGWRGTPALIFALSSKDLPCLQARFTEDLFKPQDICLKMISHGGKGKEFFFLKNIHFFYYQSFMQCMICDTRDRNI